MNLSDFPDIQANGTWVSRRKPEKNKPFIGFSEGIPAFLVILPPLLRTTMRHILKNIGVLYCQFELALPKKVVKCQFLIIAFC